MVTSTALTFVIGLALSLAVVNSEQLFICDFERDTCGFTNEEGNTATWVREETELGGREGYVMTIEPNDAIVQRASVGKSYSEIRGEIPGCFSFDYYTFGNGTRYFSSTQEMNIGAAGIWSFDDTEITSGWNKARISVNIDESTRNK
ncbi:uncharacterized protein LOC118189732 isoform X2 [Stegodyphus dumicola]|uniref:uncharacterized protein LOC118189732 isoform X2 n=1 Tax=Stegodyphus dumicola TaxID=202533 RepID=UPI0015B2A3EB|nr:uncharacterized protein LOC118189732 isoform X2 [Stegodyphus dumicola]